MSSNVICHFLRLLAEREMPHLFQNGVRPRLEVDLVRRGQGAAGQPALRLLHPAALPAQVGRRRLHQRGVPPLSAKGSVPLLEYKIEMKCARTGTKKSWLD